MMEMDEMLPSVPQGIEGQDRESYMDDQDRESYCVTEGDTMTPGPEAPVASLAERMTEAAQATLDATPPHCPYRCGVCDPCATKQIDAAIATMLDGLTDMRVIEPATIVTLKHILYSHRDH